MNITTTVNCLWTGLLNVSALREAYRHSIGLPDKPEGCVGIPGFVDYAWDNPIKNKENVRNFQTFLREHHSDQISATCQRPLTEFEEKEKWSDYAWYESQEFGDSKFVSTERYPAHKICDGCGNRYIDENYTHRSKRAIRVPKRDGVCYYDSMLNLYADERFYQGMMDHKMTGLTFEPLDRGVYRLRLALHQWQDRSGVCETCGMKTNVVYGGIFNLKEDYLYDFQYAPVNPAFLSWNHIVFSSRAWALLAEEFHDKSGLDVWRLTCPVVPGLYSDLVYPQNRMYTNGTFPTDIYTDAPPDAIAPEHTGWKISR